MKIIDDSIIKRLVVRYCSGEEDLYEEIVEMLSSYIVKYPRVIFHVSEDECSDFYEYVLKRLGAILKGYSLNKAKFTTWLTAVLRNRYLNFVKYRGSNRCTPYIRSLDIKYESGLRPLDFLADKKRYHPADDATVDDILDTIIVELSGKSRVLFHSFYIDYIRPDDVRFLSIYFGRSLHSILCSIESLKRSLFDKIRKKELILMMISDTYASIIDNQEKGFKKEEEKARKKHRELLNEYYSVKINPSYEKIEEFTGFSRGTVSSGIYRMKKSVRNIIKKNYGEKF